MNEEKYKIAYENVMIANKMLEKENQKLVKIIDELEKELRSSDENDEYKGILDILTELKGGNND